MTGDGAYDTQPVHVAVMQRNATPSMPPRKNARCANARPCAPQCGDGRMQALRSKTLEGLERLHRRSLVETKMNCIQRLGERVMSRTFERQVNGLHI